MKQDATNGHEAKNNTAHPSIDPAEIVRALKLILEPGQVTELRALEAVTRNERRSHTESGYFDDIDKLAEAADTITSAKGVYFVPNVINPALLARASNRIRPAGKEPTTSDHDIDRRNWLLVDCDVKRPAGISASEGEHAAAIELAFRIRTELSAEGWPEPIVADSGNGAHVLYRVDLPADDGGLVKRCLEGLAARFDTIDVKVDQSVFNPARIWKLYGTLAAKGDNTTDRPHRMARILEAPAKLAIVETPLLESLAAQVVTVSNSATTAAQQRNGAPRATSFDIDRWIQEHGLEVNGPDQWQGGRKWVFRVCPWNSDHTNLSACLLQHASGAISASCHHAGCQGKGWRDLRDIVEPGWHESNGSSRNGTKAATATEAPAAKTAIVTRLDQIEPEQIKWLWKGRIPQGKISVVAGEPGLSKSMLAIDIGARITRGADWPGDEGQAEQGDVIFLSAEDSASDVILPRFIEAGGDRSRAHALEAVRQVDHEGNQTERQFNLAADLEPLELFLLQLPNPRLLVVDPIGAYLGRGTDSHRDADVRSVLTPLAMLAAKHSLSVLLVAHLNKLGNSSAQNRIIGSIAFSALARAVWMVGRDKEDPARRWMSCAKNNLGSDQLALSYQLVLSTEDKPPHLEWYAEGKQMTADEMLSEQNGNDHGRDASNWLATLLAAGEKPAKEIFAEGKAVGYSDRAIRAAADSLAVQKRKDGIRGGWLWTSPQVAEAVDWDQCPPAESPKMITTPNVQSWSSSKMAPSSKMIKAPSSENLHIYKDLRSINPEDDQSHGVGHLGEQNAILEGDA